MASTLTRLIPSANAANAAAPYAPTRTYAASAVVSSASSLAHAQFQAQAHAQTQIQAHVYAPQAYVKRPLRRHISVLFLPPSLVHVDAGGVTTWTATATDTATATAPAPNGFAGIGATGIEIPEIPAEAESDDASRARGGDRACARARAGSGSASALLCSSRLRHDNDDGGPIGAGAEGAEAGYGSMSGSVLAIPSQTVRAQQREQWGSVPSPLSHSSGSTSVYASPALLTNHTESSIRTPRPRRPPYRRLSTPSSILYSYPAQPRSCGIIRITPPTASRSYSSKYSTMPDFGDKYSDSEIPQIILDTRAAASGIPGEQVEPRQTLPTEDMEPDPSKSIQLPPNRQRLVEDVIALYSNGATVERVARYAPACVYDDQFVYANDRYKMAGQWFGLPKLFPKSVNEAYEVVRNDDTVIQFKNKQTWGFHLISKEATINALVTLVLDPATKDSDFPLILYHKDQANDKDYSHEGFGFSFKKTQADIVSKLMSQKEVNYFKGDETATKEKPRKYGSGTAEAPLATHV